MADLRIIKKYIEKLNEDDNIEVLTQIYKCVMYHECKTTITKEWILCVIDSLNKKCIKDLLDIIRSNIKEKEKNNIPNYDFLN